MKPGKIFAVLFVLILAIEVCMPLVSAADDDWSYRGSFTITQPNGDSSKRIAVRQETTYYYSPSRNQWKEHILATGGAQYYNDAIGVKAWLPTYGYYGVYGQEDQLIGSFETFGDKSVYKTSTMAGKTQQWGEVTLFNGDVYRTTGPDGTYVSVTVIGNVGHFGATTTSTSWPSG